MKNELTDKELYGFAYYYSKISGLSEEYISKAMRSKAVCKIYKDDSDAEVVEEIIRRKGTLYTANEAKEKLPWKIKHNNVYIASIKYLAGEYIPSNPLYAKNDWITINQTQYDYGLYLQNMISNGSLSINDIAVSDKLNRIRVNG